MRRFLVIVVTFLLLAGLYFLFVAIPGKVSQLYGPPSGSLTYGQAYQYPLKLYWYDGLLTEPLDPGGSEVPFAVEQGESVTSIAQRLEQSQLASDAAAFRDYLIYTGLDTTVQAGEYKLSPAMSMVDIARQLQDATPAEVDFVILPGWRLEEIAASLPTSGLSITSEAFLSAASTPPAGYDFLSDASTPEGFLYPDTYVISRAITPDTLVDTFVRNFSLHLTNELTDGFSRQGLTVYQAVTLASIVEREAIKDDEAPVIASVYLNRLNLGMKLDADPTVQYALGFDGLDNTWWKNPLDLPDLQIQSSYNTYVNMGLPPGPICNPGLNSLQAVAAPAQTPYYFFRAKCDGSGYHIFAETFEEHLQNACP
jgi:UPF0755 protein